MKASCGDKENKGRETRQEYEPSLIEMAPLVTSLHVNEAGKTGLMGNRVALHEQFTVSPQRFAQLSAPCRPSAAPYSCSEECVLKECHHLSPSHIPVVPSSSKAQGFACPLFGTMDDTAVCDRKPAASNALLDTVAMITEGDNLKDIAVCDREPAGSNAFLDMVAMTTEGDNLKDISVCDRKPAGTNAFLDTVAMTAEGDNLKDIATKTADIPRSSIPTTLEKEESHDGHRIYHTPVADVMKLVKGAQYLSIGDGLQSVSALKQAGLAPQSDGYAYVGCESADVGVKVVTKDEVLPTVSKQDQDTSHKEHDRRPTRALSSECCSQQGESIGTKNAPQSKGFDTEGVPFDRPMSNDVEVPGPCSSEGHTVIIEDDLEHGKEKSPDARRACDSLIESSSICKIEVGTAQDADVSTKPVEGFSSIFDIINRGNTGKAAREMPCVLGRNESGACGESANKNNCHCGVAESSQEDIEMGDSLKDSESCWASSLSPKAVIQVLGQLRFWKARLALIRQQRIFSDQVFELHKLIEVQRLLAGTPYTSIDEIYFGVGHMNLECDADGLTSHMNLKCDANALASHSGLIDEKESVGDAPEKQIVVSKQVVGEAKRKPINSQAHLEPCPAVPDVVQGGVSAWGYPGVGVGHWNGPLPAAGAFPCPPLAGSFAPGSAVDGLFAAPVLRPEGTAMVRSPIIPFSFPFCSQQPHHTPSVRTPIACVHQQHPAPYHESSPGHAISNHSGPRTPYRMYWAAEGPMASVASISSQSDMKQQVSYLSSFNSQRYLHEEEVQPGRKGLSVSGSQPEDLQRTHTGSKVNSSTAMPANKLWQHSEHNAHGLSPAINMKHHDYDAEKMETFIKEVRGCKRQKERRQQESLATGKEVDANYSPNPSSNALNLFPLAPTRSLEEHGTRRPLGGSNEWQGHVIKVVPRAAISTPESAAGILLSIQQERKPQL